MEKLRRVRNQKGFTLVEIAIVLVIVGLLIGGVLKGSEMIKSGKTKKVEKISDGIRSAISIHLDKAGKLPGDAANDGQIDTTAACFTDLFNAKIVNSDNPPADPFGGTILVNYYALDGAGLTGGNAAGHYIVFPGLKNDTDIATQIDAKYDDGDLANGSMGNGTDGFVMPL